MTTLKGYVEKNDREFEWKSKPGACDTCKVLNGTSYTLKKDIPDKTHPNCTCKVENNFKVDDEDGDKRENKRSARDKAKDTLIKLKKRQKLKDALKIVFDDNLKYSKENLEVYAAQFAKRAIDIAMGGLNVRYLNKINDAKELWKIASHNFNQSKNYIKQNGMVVLKVADFPAKDLRNIIKEKLIEQLGVEDAPGVLFSPGSNLSQGIMYSKEFQQHIKKNLPELIKGRVIEKASTYFGSDENLKLALGHADILYTTFDKNGNLYSFILDTYDFNKDDRDIKVKMAYLTQKTGIIRNYYTVNVIFMPSYLVRSFF